MKPAWFPDWSNEIGALVASGQSAILEDMGKLRGRTRVVVINNSWQLAPWADMLYASDPRWWDSEIVGYGRHALRDFRGMMVTQDANAAKHHKLHLIRLWGQEQDKHANEMKFDEPGVVGRGGNSAFHTLNMIAQFGCRRILLVGLDLHGQHWHGAHAQPCRDAQPDTLNKWAARFDMQEPVLRARGIEVINCSPRSALKAYQRMVIDDALNPSYACST